MITETVRISDGLLRKALDGIACQVASDNRLTLKAQGVMARLLGQLALMEFDASHLAASPYDDTATTAAALRELADAGYVSVSSNIGRTAPCDVIVIGR